MENNTTAQRPTPLSGEPPVIPAPTAPALPPDPNPGSWNGYGYAPQEGWYSGPQPYPTSPDAASWQSKYEQQKRRSVILAISTAAAAVIAVVALVWGFAAQSGSAGATAGGAGAGGLGATGGQQFGGGTSGGTGGSSNGQQFGGPPGMSGQSGTSGQGGMAAGPGALDPSSLFNSDGSVNTSAVKQFLAMLPPGLSADQLVSQLQSSGAITSAEAEKLKAAITAAAGGSTSSGTSSGTNSGTSSGTNTTGAVGGTGSVGTV